MASWLADAGSGGAAEYLPADALARRLRVDAAARAAVPGVHRVDDDATAVLRKATWPKLEETLGAGFVANLTAAMGTEAAFALNGFSASGPTWMMVGLANDPAVIDSSLPKLVDTFNAELPPGEQDKRGMLGAGERGRTDRGQR